ncbi:MAG: hypothetical protein ACFFCF_06090 [Promethearchaeota archaeon]
MGFEIPFEKIQAAIKQYLSFEADPITRTIRLEFRGTIYEEMPFGDMLEDEEGLKRMAKNIMDEDIQYTAEPLPEGKGVLLHFETEDEYQKMYDFIDGIVNGDLLQELMKKVLQSMFSAMDDDSSEFDNTT